MKQPLNELVGRSTHVYNSDVNLNTVPKLANALAQPVK